MKQPVDRGQVEMMLASVREEYDRAVAELEDVQSRLNAYASTVAGLTAWLALMDKQGADGGKGTVTPSPEDHTNGEALKLPGWEPSYVRPKDAILRLVEEPPHRIWSLAEIVATMRERQWLDPALSRPIEAVRAAANRLVDVDHKLLRAGVSSYRVPTPIHFHIGIEDRA